MKIDYFCLPPIIQSAIAGIANAEFCQTMLNSGVGMVTLGGFSIDEKNIKATKNIITRGRKEFLLPEDTSDIKRWCEENLHLRKSKKSQKIAINLRIVEIDLMSKSWLNSLSNFVDYFEINAHCRQKEITEIGGGQALLTNTPYLEELLEKIRLLNKNAKIGIKIRGNVVNNVFNLIEILERNDCDYIHIDAMIPGKKQADLGLIKKFSNKTNIPIIGNNLVRNISDIHQMLSVGAKAISIARPLIDNPAFMEDLVAEYMKVNR